MSKRSHYPQRSEKKHREQYREQKKKHKENYKEIDLSDGNSCEPDKHRRSRGRCEGCGQDGARLRCTTCQYLCEQCRETPRYKLISKTTALGLYPSLTWEDLMNSYKRGRINCFFCKNWYNSRAPPIKLYFQSEVEDLAMAKEKGLI